MSIAAEAKRIVIKVGTSTLTHPSGHINIRLMEKLVKVLADIKNTDRELVLVSSGAIGVGVGKLGLRERPKTIPGKQAAAAVGQCELMYLYDKYFSEYNHTVGQVLLTRYSLDDAESRENVRNTFEALLGMGAIPVGAYASVPGEPGRLYAAAPRPVRGDGREGRQYRGCRDHRGGLPGPAGPFCGADLQ